MVDLLRPGFVTALPRLTLAAALLLPAPAVAQRPMLTVFTVVGDGLPSGGVSGLTQDASGRVWFLSRGRVTVYDGSEFAVLGAAHGLPSVRFAALALDARGRAVAVLRDEPRIYRQARRGEPWRELAIPTGGAHSPGRSLALAVTSRGGRELIVVATVAGGLRLFDGRAWSVVGADQGLPAAGAPRSRRSARFWRSERAAGSAGWRRTGSTARGASVTPGCARRSWRSPDRLTAVACSYSRPAGSASWRATGSRSWRTAWTWARSRAKRPSESTAPGPCTSERVAGRTPWIPTTDGSRRSARTRASPARAC